MNWKGRAARCRVWRVPCGGTQPQSLGLGSGDAGWAQEGSTAPRQLWECRLSPFLSKNHIYLYSQTASTVGKWQYGSSIEFFYSIFLRFAPQTPCEHVIHVWVTTSSTSWGKTLPKDQALVKLFPLTHPVHPHWFHCGQSWDSAFYCSSQCEEFEIFLVMQSNRIIVPASKSGWKAQPNSFLAHFTFLMPEFIRRFL